jgi:hypothetical protein
MADGSGRPFYFMTAQYLIAQFFTAYQHGRVCPVRAGKGKARVIHPSARE